MRYEGTTARFRWRRRLRPFGVEWLVYRYVQARLRARTEAHRQRSVDLDALLERLSAKKLVFALTPGRSGSEYASRLFALLPDTVSLHEPEPAFERWLRRAQTRRGAAREFLIHYKLPFIAAQAAGRYVELSNAFGKGFVEPMLALGMVPSLIVLRRAPRPVALSNLERYAVPGRTEVGWEWLVQPSDPGVLPLPGWRRMSDYQLCFWYALEMERRQRVYAEAVRSLGGRTCDVTAGELHDPRRFLRAAAELDLLGDGTDEAALRRGHAEVSAVRHNTNPRRLRVETDLDAEEEAVWQAVQRVEPDLRAAVASRYAEPSAPAPAEGTPDLQAARAAP